MKHQLKHLYISTPARSGSFIREELLETADIAYATGEGALPELRTVTIETFFNVPKEWASGDLLLHRGLKKRWEHEEDGKRAGVLWAVLQAT